jgi:hypothetical protein
MEKWRVGVERCELVWIGASWCGEMRIGVEKCRLVMEKASWCGEVQVGDGEG